MKEFISRKAALFTESVIREMTRQAQLHGAINLSQGFPDFPAPDELKQAACDAINADINQYAVTWGSKRFRDAIAAKTKWNLGLDVDPDREIVVTCGSTEAMIATMLGTVDPDEEVIVFEPYYENYGPDAILTEAKVRYVTLHPPNWSFDPAELRAAFNANTKAIIITNPHNPTGKVFSYDELRCIADLCIEFDAFAFTDEIYEHIWYPAATRDVRHIAMATLDGMRERTVTINGMSKTYSVTGWRVGYAIAPPAVTDAIRKVHDFLTVGAAAPLQEAGVHALSLPQSYYDKLQTTYLQKRDFLLGVLEEAGFRCYKPDGAYYIMTDISRFGFANDVEFTKYLISEIGVAVVPGSSFYSQPELGAQQIRFCYCKREETLQAAAEKLQKLK
ncbi:MAG: aminotransferase class I/II-fold pyridoxal phosphate-dependent enzyme [Acidobacteria bacterium]|nr:aminotransferase class I/II-fold pyridoxal phosphate-dependent enzyme [Acidobacteriota bacterium]